MNLYHFYKYPLVLISLILLSINCYADSWQTNLEWNSTLNSSGTYFSTLSKDGRTVIMSTWANPQWSAGDAYKIDQDGNITNLGRLGGSRTYVRSVSEDGQVITGSSKLTNDYQRAIKYTEQTGLINLGTLPGHDESYGEAVSADGSTIIGFSRSFDEPYKTAAFKHTNQNGLVNLGTLGDGNTVGNALSADGSVIVGFSYINFANGQYHAFKYTDEGGITDLGTLGGLSSNATHVSEDGKVIAGTSLTQPNSTYFNTFKYTDEGGMINIGTLGGNSTEISSLSADGSTIVGSASDFNTTRAFKHTDKTGIIALDTNTLYSKATDTNYDGSVIVGSAGFKVGQTRAFWYSDASGMIDLGTIEEYDSEAYAVSKDGSIVLGQVVKKTGNERSNHVVLWQVNHKKDEPNEPNEPNIISPPVDLDNTYTELDNIANQAQSMLDFRHARLSNLVQQNCVVTVGRICVGAFAGQSYGKQIKQTDIGILLAIKLSEQWQLGTVADFATNTDLPHYYHRTGNNNPGIALYLDYAQKPEQGIHARMATAYVKDSVTIKRPTLSYTEAGQGDAVVKGLLHHLDMGYQFKFTKIGVKPYLSLQYSNISRSAYKEDDSISFPVRFSQMGERRTTVGLGLKVHYPLTSKLQLNTDIGMDKDIHNNRQSYLAHLTQTQNFNLPSVYVQQQDKNPYRPYAALGLRYQSNPNTALLLNSSWSEQSYRSEVMRLQLSLHHSF
ncbi:hypothetical protein [Zophobihabitans entericus]|uniref:Autotransporter domain-containing protein n=1 Tax=Zophobihabitans entericus TaxID=1635327 RepID=A0A6G9IB57_9GAMM|nr:hypothetical protein [Zophobihabitans entericus]QIQ21468.1 hypothetical protein IPMB12_07090 [Zophobihabitans entericus]